MLVSERNPSFVLMQPVFLSVDVRRQRGLRGGGARWYLHSELRGCSKD